MKKKGFRRQEALRHLPDPLKHRVTRQGIIVLWKQMAKRVYSPQVLSGLPPFAEFLAKSFWDTEPEAVVDAMMDGDPAFFVAFQIRLDQIHVALTTQNASIAQRAPVIRCKYILDGFKQAAVENLERLGGVWPPAISGAPEESPD